MISKPDIQNIEEELKERRKNLSFFTSMFQQDIRLTTSFLVIYFLLLVVINFMIIGKFFNFTILTISIILGVGINVVMALDTVMAFKKATSSARMIKNDRNRSFLDFLLFSQRTIKDDKRISFLNICFIILFIVTVVFGVYFIFQRHWFFLANLYMFTILLMYFEMHRNKFST